LGLRPDSASDLIALDPTTPAVVLNSFGGFHFPGVARTLGRMGVEVWGLYGRPAAAQTSRFYRETRSWSVNSSPARALEELLQLGAALGSRPLLIPEDDVSLAFVEDNADDLREGFLFADRAPGLAARLSSKQGMYELCAEHGIPTPTTVFPRTRSQVAEAAETFQFPLVLKGIDGARLRARIGATMTIVSSRDELLQQYDALEDLREPNLMLQEYIPGTPASVWMFEAYFDRSSDCVFGITGQKLRQYPPYTGMTSLGVCVRNEVVADQAKKLMRAVGYRGPLDCGFRYDERDGTYKLLDVNPRVGASFRLFVSNNDADVVTAMYLDLTGQAVPAWEPVEGRKWVAENSDVISSIVYWRNGELSLGGWLRSLRGVDETAWFTRDDLRPAFTMLRRSLGSIVFDGRGRP
jgi:D-aspartate ligase